MMTRRIPFRRLAGGVLGILLASSVLPASNAAASSGFGPITTACPGLGCPYAPPTETESQAAQDVLARMNLERSEPQRAYPYGGADTPLLPLAPAGGAAQETAQAVAEWEAANSTITGYEGPRPPGYSFGTGQNDTAAGDTAGIDDAIMHSYGHALGVLSAAPTEVAIGAACSAGGTLYVTEQFYNSDQASYNAGQDRFRAELAANNVYVSSGGTVTTVTDATGTGPAANYLPQQPIVAGYGTGFSDLYATGADWTCSGVRYPPGSSPTSPLPAPVTGIAASPSGGGYLLVNGQGAVSVHGDATFHGAANGLALAAPIQHIVPTADGGGYWMVAADGGVFAFGDAPFFGSMGGRPLNAPVIDLAPTPDGGGYWLVAADGGVFAFGDAPFYGSMGGRPLNAAMVAVAAAPSGGYWMVAADGGVFSFGTPFFGSTGGLHLNRPIVGMATTVDGAGYWLVATDGGVFAFGDSGFFGSAGDLNLAQPVVGMAADPAGAGYWLAAADGGVFAFGAPFFGAD